MREYSKQKAKGWVWLSLILLGGACFAGGAQAFPFAKNAFRFTSVVEPAKPPAPWLKFCKRHPADCEADPASAREIELNAETFDLLKNINLLVNRVIKPQTDKKHWGVEDVWSYPDDGYGDCEDYGLLKRRLLIEAGIPAAALVMAVVWEKNNGHAVLLARTNQGDYALDNLSNKIQLWSQTTYRFVKRQSSRDPKQWVYIDGDPRKPNVALTAWEKEPPLDKLAVLRDAPVEIATAATASTQTDYFFVH